MRWLEKAALKDHRLTPTFLINSAIDSLMAKEKEDRDPTPEEVAKFLAEKREIEQQLKRIVGPLPVETGSGAPASTVEPIPIPAKKARGP